MPTTPWRIAAQSYTVCDPETKEPAFTLSFIVDHAQADMMKLRMTPANEDGAALEMQFATGGFVTGDPIKQPRWLKAFERPAPQFVSEDAAMAYRDALPQGVVNDDGKEVPSSECENFDRAYEPYRKRREEWERVHGKPASEQQSAGGAQGPDSTDPNSPEAEAARTARSSVDNTSPSAEDRKGMVTQPGGRMAGETAAQADAQKPLAPNAPDQALQAQGKSAKTLEQLNADAASDPNRQTPPRGSLTGNPPKNETAPVV